MMRSIELFAGAGGLAIGACRAGFHPAAVVEWDRAASNTLRHNRDAGLEPLATWPLIEADVRDFSYAEFEGNVELLTGGPPCQPFSLGGKHRGKLDHRDMFPEVIRAVREVKPRAFIIENVRGLTRSAFAHYLEYIQLQLQFPDVQQSRHR